MREYSEEDNQDESREELIEIAENSGLANVELQAAMMDACGVRPGIIGKKLGKGTNWVSTLRGRNENYRRTVQSFYGLIAQKIVQDAGDVKELFNGQIRASARTLIEIRDSAWAKDADRIKAALAFLDRAPEAPKATEQRDVRTQVIQIPIEVMEGMREVLVEDKGEGNLEILRLVEGRGGEEGEITEEYESENDEGEIKVRRL